MTARAPTRFFDARSPVSGARRVASARAGGVLRLLRDVLVGDVPVHPAARADRLQKVSAAFCEAHDIRIQSHGFVAQAPVIVVVNHISWLDPFVMGALVPALPLAKAELRNWPAVGGALARLGVILVERECLGSRTVALRRVLRALGMGASIVNYPEGTTTRGPLTLPFHRGIFGAARVANVAVVPAYVAYDEPALAWVGDATFVPHYLMVARRRKTRAWVRFGRPLDPRRHQSAEQLARAARDAIHCLAKAHTET